MPCYHPLTIPRKFADGKHSANDLFHTVPCGQCIGCRLERSRQWAIRICHEQQMYEDNVFLTLTYSEDKLPPERSLRKEDMTLFIKRLRKSIEPTKIRYFQCGEYGGKTDRPHHHMILFNYDFPDKVFHKLMEDRKERLYTSKMLDKLWAFGQCLIGAVTFESAAYVARYCVDKLTGEKGKQAYEMRKRIPPYVTMSRRPGIGAGWMLKFHGDVWPWDEVVLPNRGKCKPPKFYDKKLDQSDPELFLKIKRNRREAAESNPDHHNWQRLRTKEEVQKEKVKEIKRKH